MTSISPSLQRSPDLDTWIKIHDDGQISIYPGKVELGQHIRAALALIAAEELDVDVKQIRIESVDTDRSANEMYTSGSGSMEESGSAVRQASAHARQIMLTMAAEQLSVDVDQLEVNNGEIRAPGINQWSSYSALMAGKTFNCPVSLEIQPKPSAQYRQIGKQAVEPEEITAIVTGSAHFLHDMELPGMLYGRVIRPPNYHAEVEQSDDAAVRAMPGVIEVVRDGNFIGVIAECEDQVIKAAARLQAAIVWSNNETLDDDDIYTQLTEKPRESRLVIDGIPQEVDIPANQAPDNAAKTITASYRRPYHMHASLGPSAAVAQLNESGLTVWTHAQGVYPTRTGIATVMAMEEKNVRVIHVPGPGCYGHNAADDASLDAALLARAVSPRPLMLNWSREDEHSWEPYGSAMLMQLQASLDEQGQVIQWRHESYSDTHIKRMREPIEGKSPLLAAWHLEHPFTAPEPGPNPTFNGGIHRNATPVIYNFPDQAIIKHRVYGLPLRVSALRSLGAYANIFAIESFMDELAHAAEIDPLTFRLNHIHDERARAVLEKVAEISHWGKQSKKDGEGHGLAVARYKNNKCYVAVAIHLNVDDYGQITLKKAFIAADSGQIVDPEGLRNQMEGGLIQAASWTLKEQVTFDKQGITSRDWDSYPILRFGEIPEIETILINRPDYPYLGSGEGTTGPTPAAIANAVYDAVGLRLRQIPFTAERVRDVAAGF